MHVLHAHEFRGYVHEDLSGAVTRIDERDIADLRCGLAFRVEDRENGRFTLRSKQQCTRLLNGVVRDLENARALSFASLIAVHLLSRACATWSRPLLTAGDGWQLREPTSRSIMTLPPLLQRSQTMT